MEELVEKHMYNVLHFVVLVLTSIVGAGAGAPDAANGGGEIRMDHIKRCIWMLCRHRATEILHMYCNNHSAFGD